MTIVLQVLFAVILGLCWNAPCVEGRPSWLTCTIRIGVFFFFFRLLHVYGFYNTEIPCTAGQKRKEKK